MIANDKRDNLFGSGRFQINNDWQAYVQGIYCAGRDAPRHPAGTGVEPVHYGPLNSIDSVDRSRCSRRARSIRTPGGRRAASTASRSTCATGRSRTVSATRRTRTSIWNIVGGVKGNWAQLGLGRARGFYTEGKTKQRINGGFQDYRQLLPLLNSGTVNLFGPNTPEIVAQLQVDQFRRRRDQRQVEDLRRTTRKTSGEIWKLPAGPLALAVGVEAHKEELDQDIRRGALQTATSPASAARSRTVGKTARSGRCSRELNVPIVKTLEGNVAVRYDHYSDFGSTTNPKVSLRWQPTRTVLVRGSYGTGFLAPTLYQLSHRTFSGVSAAGPDRPDPLPGHQRHRPRLQHAVQRAVRRQPELKPEESEQATFGVVLRADSQRVVQRRLLQDQPDRTRSRTAFAGSTILAMTIGPVRVPVTRGPDDRSSPGLPGRITSIDQTYINLGAVRIQGSTSKAITGRRRKPGVACRSTCRARTTCKLRRAEPRRVVLRARSARLRSSTASTRRDSALEALRIADVGPGPVVCDTRADVSDVVYRHSDRPATVNCRDGRLAEHSGTCRARTRASRTGSSRSA